MSDSEAPRWTVARVIEGGVASFALLAMAFLPIAEAALRLIFGVGIPGSFPFVQHLTLWVTFLGAALAAREGKLLALATGELLPAGHWRSTARLFSSAVGAAVSVLLCRAAVDLIVIERQGTQVLISLPLHSPQPRHHAAYRHRHSAPGDRIRPASDRGPLIHMRSIAPPLS